MEKAAGSEDENYVSKTSENSFAWQKMCNETGMSNYTRGVDWKISTALFSFSFVFGVYILVSFSIYEIRLQTKINCRHRFGKRRNRITALMSALLLGAQVLAVVRFIIQLFEAFFMEEFVGENCNIFRKLEVICFTTAMTWIYLVLWIRQHGLYRMTAPQLLQNKALRITSTAVPVVMIISNIICTVLYVETKTFLPTIQGCTLCQPQMSVAASTIILLFNEILFQTILLGLLLYPIIKNHVETRKVLELPKHHQHHLALVVRATVGTFTAGLFNLVTTVIAINTNGNIHPSYHKFIYNIDFFVTIICICVTFSDWRCRLLPCCYNEVQNASARSTTRLTKTISTSVHATRVSLMYTTRKKVDLI